MVPPHVVLDRFQFGIQSRKGSAWASGCMQRITKTIIQFLAIFKQTEDVHVLRLL